MIKELKKLQQEQKELARSKGSYPKDKVIEECCEVLMDHLEGRDTEEEEWDLLMCLIDKHLQNGEGFGRWYAKQMAKKHELTSEQEEFRQLIYCGDQG